MLYLSRIKKFLTKSGGTVTPGTSQKIACEEGRYTTGTIYVAGDSNLKSENIKSGVSIFGIAGTLKSPETISGHFSVYGGIIYYYDAENEEYVSNVSSNDRDITIYKNSIVVLTQASLYQSPTVTGGDMQLLGAGVHGRSGIYMFVFTDDNFRAVWM